MATIVVQHVLDIALFPKYRATSAHATDVLDYGLKIIFSNITGCLLDLQQHRGNPASTDPFELI